MPTPASRRTLLAAWSWRGFAAVLLAGFALWPLATSAEIPPLPTPAPDRPAAPQAPAASSTKPTNGSIAPPAKPPETPEGRYRAALAAIVAPIVARPRDSDDMTALRNAIAAINQRDPAKAIEVQASIKDPVIAKLATWYRLQRGFASVPEARAFIADNPDWPDPQTIQRRMEDDLLAKPPAPDEVRRILTALPPSTGAGRVALANALLALGDTAAANRLAVAAWRDDAVPDEHEAAFLQAFGAQLTPADHQWRFDVASVTEPRWRADRRRAAAAARRVIPRLPAAEQAKATARVAVVARERAAEKLIAALPADDPAKPDWGLTYHRVVLLRRAGKTKAAAALLATAPVDPKVLPNLDSWWDERHAVAIALLAEGHAKQAYALVRDAGPLGENPAKEQAFIAGQLALRHLGDAKAAARHFADLRKAADGPLSRSSAEYWLGTAHSKAGDRTTAAAHFTAGAAYLDTFHGHLARRVAYPDQRGLPIPLPSLPTAAETRRFLARDAVTAARLALHAGLNRRDVMTFFARLSRQLDNEAELALVGELALALGETQIAVRLGKAAVARGFNLYIYAYPLQVLPTYEPLRPPPEPAMLLGIARQETEFDTRIVSRAGARGILQVMPITARHVCRDYKITCTIPRLKTDAAYNIKLASAYIADRQDEFSGSYILTLTGYNAGPGRTRQWLAKYGDPRRPPVDPLDWIYRIPFDETREYVQKVLSNVQVYRARLGEPDPLRIDTDLARARSGGPLKLPSVRASGQRVGEPPG